MTAEFAQGIANPLLNGANDNTALMAITREGDWTWAIPTEDEWYKAA